MNRREAQQQLERQLVQRIGLIKDDLERSEIVRDAGPVNDYRLNTSADAAAGEGLLFITDRRLLLFCEGDGRSRSWPFESILKWSLDRGPTRQMKELVVGDGSSATHLVGGKMFLELVSQILRAHRPRRV